MNILVLGASGMLGSAVYRVFSERADWQVFGAVRSPDVKNFFPDKLAEGLVIGCDVEENNALEALMAQIRPDVVINCVALGKGSPHAGDPLRTIALLSILPQRLARLCRLADARLVQISSDGVFSGAKGGYVEDDFPDATDLYGAAKFLGEVRDAQTITLRTSIIGHELHSGHGLVSWFLAQEHSCKCFTRAIFSGFPVVVLARIMRDVIVPRPELSGIYHVAAQPVSKFDLLSLVAEIYGKSIEMVPDDRVVIDRSLNAERFRKVTGYVAPDWRELVTQMHYYQKQQ